MLVGMGIVFLFLAMLVVAVNLMSAAIQRLFPQVPVEVSTTTNGTDPRVIAAISAAVHQYRSKHKS